MRRDGLQPLHHLQPGRARRHHEGRQAPRAGGFSGTGEDRVDIGNPTIGNPRLLAVQDKPVAVSPRFGGEVGNVRARGRF